MLRPSVLLASLAIFPLQEASQPFEGSLEIRETQGDEQQLHRYDFQGGKVRVENLKEEDSLVILDWDAKRFFLLMPSQKVYLEMSGRIQDLLSLSAASQKNSPSSAKPLVMTPPSPETIAETPCNLWKIPALSSRGEVELRMAEGFGSHAARFAALTRHRAEKKDKDPYAFGAWEKLAIEKGAFPFRIVEKKKDGKERRRIEVLKAERRSFPQGHFSIPPGYTGLTMDTGGKKGKN